MYNIAIDGPAGAGKSTIAKRLSKELGFVYVDTGAMYRALALYFIRAGIDAKEEEKICAALDRLQVDIAYGDEGQIVLLNGEDVSAQIRGEAVGGVASAISVYKPVREKLLGLQRELAARNDVVMDGRDIGSFVLPHADLKIYLSASPEVRARRRVLEMREKGMELDFDHTRKEIEERDTRDMQREVAPLIKAEDAVFIDSSEMNIDAVVERIKSLLGKR